MSNTQHSWLPAFPTSEEHGSSEGYPGMTLRDYFAAKALSGLIGRDWSHTKGEDEEIIAGMVKSSYTIANLMMIEREKSSD